MEITPHYHQDNTLEWLRLPGRIIVAVRVVHRHVGYFTAAREHVRLPEVATHEEACQLGQVLFDTGVWK